MSRIFTIALGSLITLSFTAGFAQAQWDDCSDGGHCQKFWYDYYRNKSWPLPFRAIDTRATLSYFEVQRNNGWKLHNTVGTAMFDHTGALNDSGRAHVRWIVSRAPRDRRVVFVLDGATPQETARRIEATEVEISRLIPTGALPQIYRTDKDAPGSTGSYQTAIARAINTSVPEPRLPTNSQAASSGSTP